MPPLTSLPIGNAQPFPSIFRFIVVSYTIIWVTILSVKYSNVCPVKSGSLRIVLFILCSGILFRSKRTEVPVLKKYGFPLRAVAFLLRIFYCQMKHTIGRIPYIVYTVHRSFRRLKMWLSDHSCYNGFRVSALVYAANPLELRISLFPVFAASIKAVPIFSLPPPEKQETTR